MSIPEFVTFTGADDATSLEEMAALAHVYPVEFAILFSDERQGSPRFPSLQWIKRAQASGLKLAAHICGAYAKEIVNTGQCRIDLLLHGFSRIQVNTAAAVSPSVVRGWTDVLERHHGRRIEPILQFRGQVPSDICVSWLYDRSGGRGVSPEIWPIPTTDIGTPIGYAGGLGPDTIAAVLPLLPQLPGLWVDMETKVRDASDAFDLGLCRQVCKLIYG